MPFEVKPLALTSIRTNGGTQTRVGLNAPAVREYGEAMTEGAKLPPVTVFFDGTDHWLADGFHRVQASMDIGALSIDAEIRPGNQRDAVLYSAGANGAHGVQRSHQDKRKAILIVLKDPEWGSWSDRDIARQCRVNRDLVGKVRKEFDTATDDLSGRKSQMEDPPSTTKKVSRGGKTYEMDTSGVVKSNEKRAKEKPAAKAAEPAGKKPEEPAATTVATTIEKHDESPGPVETSKPLTAAAQAKAAKQESKAVEENVALKARVAELEEELAAYQENCADLRDEVKALSAAVDPNHAKKFLEQSGYVRVLESQRNELLDKNARLAREVKSLQKRLGHA